MRAACLTLLSMAPVIHAAPVDFVRDVQPIFEKHCHVCHGPDKQKNGYRVDVKREAFTAGDEHAPNIRPGKGAESPLYRFVSGADEKIQMPPKEKDDRLSAGEVAVLRRWIDEGAVWPDEADKSKLVDRTDWWSFKPLEKTQPSKLQNTKYKIQNGIDDFVAAKLSEKGWPQSPEADARTLIRRVYHDLIGLPPSPAEVKKFVTACGNDPQQSLQTYEALVDRLLASPRYGERWARHWLDVAHYGETHGYDKDRPRPNAWPYRDHVIRAFNEDKPYARFIEEQIAGDVLYPGTVDGITALGFIAAGPWDAIGHMEVPETKIDGKIARHLDRDDMVQNTIGAFCSLTIGCAQCHNHKFDPITQEDYYSLQAVFAALDRTDVKFYPDAENMRRFRELGETRKATLEALATLEASLQGLAGERYAALTRRIEGASETGTGPNARPDFGYHSAISKTRDVTKWVQVDLGGSCNIDKVVLRPCYDDYNQIGAGFGFPVRFKVEASDDAEFKSGVTLLWKKHDSTFMNDFKNPGLHAFETGGARDDGVTGRYVRVTAVTLAPRKNDYIFALAEMQVLDVEGKNLALHRPVSSLDSIEAPPRWRKSNLTDGIAPEARSAKERESLIRERETLMLTHADESTKRKRAALRERLEEVEGELKKLPPPEAVFAGTVHTGNGNFRGTGNEGGKPRTIQLLKRGDVKNPGKETSPQSIKAITELAHVSFPLKSDDEGSRRAALAAWITDKNNPLTWRSFVNRVWQHHFGRALVDTPNDFGRMGALPSHPQLLDWLAVTFRDDFGGSLKQLHKLILMSHTYRQSSHSSQSSQDAETRRQGDAEKGVKGIVSVSPHLPLSASSPLALSPSPRLPVSPSSPAISPTSSALAIDSSNSLLWRQNRRKLDAESVRDSILAVSGRLDLTMSGPSFQDFVVTQPEHSPHYEYHLHDPEDPRSWRRSIYRFIVRSQQQPFMTTLDCADPSMRVDKRNESLSPLQALAMMNNGLIVSMARHFAGRVAREGGGLEAQVRRAFELALVRTPAKEELDSLLEYAKREGMENVCRVLLNLNEFSFVN